MGKAKQPLNQSCWRTAGRSVVTTGWAGVVAVAPVGTVVATAAALNASPARQHAEGADHESTRKGCKHHEHERGAP